MPALIPLFQYAVAGLAAGLGISIANKADKLVTLAVIGGIIYQIVRNK